MDDISNAIGASKAVLVAGYIMIAFVVCVAFTTWATWDERKQGKIPTDAQVESFSLSGLVVGTFWIVMPAFLLGTVVLFLFFNFTTRLVGGIVRFLLGENPDA